MSLPDSSKMPDFCMEIALRDVWLTGILERSRRMMKQKSSKLLWNVPRISPHVAQQHERSPLHVGLMRSMKTHKDMI